MLPVDGDRRVADPRQTRRRQEPVERSRDQRVAEQRVDGVEQDVRGLPADRVERQHAAEATSKPSIWEVAVAVIVVVVFASTVTSVAAIELRSIHAGRTGEHDVRHDHGALARPSRTRLESSAVIVAAAEPSPSTSPIVLPARPIHARPRCGRRCGRRGRSRRRPLPFNPSLSRTVPSADSAAYVDGVVEQARLAQRLPVAESV